MLIRLISTLILAVSSPINSGINTLQVQPPDYAAEWPPLSGPSINEPAIAYETAVRLDPPTTTTIPPIEFSSDSANGRCIGAEGLLSEYNPGWNVERMSRIMYRESRCNPTVRNSQSGSTGLLQIMPSNCRYIANQLGESCTIAKLQNPTFNIRAATTLFEYDGYGPWKL